MKQVLALVDCNSFYCSCERLFAPHLEKRPVAVLSNNDGIVVARTNELKELGVNLALPYHQIKDILDKHNVAVFSSNYALYGDISARVMKTLSQLAPEIEVYSIDEAFLNLTGINEVENHGKKIKDVVKKHIGIPVSVGIAHTKVLAKLANRIAKKKKQHEGVFSLLDESTHDEVLSQTKVEDLWGIAGRSAEKLKRIGIHTAKDLRDANEKIVLKYLTITGRRIQDELKGIPSIPLEQHAKDKKQIVSSRSFGKPVFTLDELKQAVATYITSAAEKLRRQKSVCSLLQVFVHTNRFKNVEQYFNITSVYLQSGTSATNKLISAAFEGLERIYKPGIEYKKAGIILCELHPKQSYQLSLIEPNDSLKDDLLMTSIDKINGSMGKFTAKFAACGINSNWKMLNEMKTPNYTTRWSELLKVK